MKNYAFLYNPAAGGPRSEAKIRALERKISHQKNSKLFYSKNIGDISNFIERRFSDFDVFVACGGDGTIREMASQLMHTEKEMGIIPMGTGNDLCKTLNIPRELSAALDLVFNGISQKIDVGKCNDFIFLNSLGFGFDGLTNRYANSLKHLHPFLCYAVSAIKAIFTHKSFTTTLIDEDENTFYRDVIMISLANGRVEGGSFWIAPEASITDGKLNCVSVNPISKWFIPMLLPFFLIKKPNWIPLVTTKKYKALSLNISDNVDIHADGEIIETIASNFDIQLAHKALKVICNL